MRKVTLLFPDVSSITEFVLSYKVSKAIVNTSEKTLTATMPEQHLNVAVKQYRAKIKGSSPVNLKRAEAVLIFSVRGWQRPYLKIQL